MHGGFLLVAFFVLAISPHVKATCVESCSCKSSCNICRQGSITTLCFKNLDYFEMGYWYGHSLNKELRETLQILKGYYHLLNVSYDNLVGQAQKFFDRYNSLSYTNFLKGMAEGAGLSFDDCKILNGMETLHGSRSTSEELKFGCAFVYVPPVVSSTKSGIVARNYDYGPPFKTISSKNLIVTLIADGEKTPTAIIGMPGQIYCPTCVSASNVFVELNNAESSGGFGPDKSRKTLLINLLEQLQNSHSIISMGQQLRATESDYALVINVADSKETTSFEFSKSNGMKLYHPFKNRTFVSTNFFLNDTWNIPPPTDAETSIGVTRRNNLINLLNKSNLNVQQVKEAMDVRLVRGGARWAMTIYQMVYDTSLQLLYIRSPHRSSTWTEINLRNLFNDITNDVKKHSFN